MLCAVAAALVCIAALTAFPHRFTGGGDQCDDTLPAASGTRGPHSVEAMAHATTSQAVKHSQRGFLCPWVPALPCLGGWVNLYLMASLPAASCTRLLAWSAAGAAVYLSYGVWHSTAGGNAPSKAM